MTLSTDLNNIRNQSPDDLRTTAYRERLKTAKIDDDVSAKLLEDRKLGGAEDIAFLEGRQENTDVPADKKATEKPLLSALKDLETSDTDSASQPKPWTTDSVFKSPGGDLDAVRKGDVTLENGHGGPVVGEVQKLLADAGYPEPKHGIDQRFGDATETRVRDFQRNNELKETGKVDTGTLAKLEAAAKAKQEPSSDPKATAKDAVATTLKNFDTLQKDGFVTKDQLAKVAGGKELADNLDALVFAKPGDPGAQAWNGLSKGDLQAIQARLDKGESIADISKRAMKESFVGKELAAKNPNFTTEQFSSAVQQHRAQHAVQSALDGFDKTAKDGFVSRQALAKVPGGHVLAERFDALIFGKIESGKTAWNGVSRADLQTVQARLRKGDSLDDITKDLMRNSHVGKALLAKKGDFTFQEFAAAVAAERQRQDRA